MRYEDVISAFIYKALPISNTKASIKLEAISSTIIGTKQRRNGPVPSPETQVAIRDVVRYNMDRVDIFVPWASRKQLPDSTFDILDFMALKQLSCLVNELSNIGVQTRMYFRVEDATDMFLFRHEKQNQSQIEAYINTFNVIAGSFFPTSNIYYESSLMGRDAFEDMANPLAQQIYNFMRTGKDAPEGFVEPTHEQLSYMTRAYTHLMPGRDPIYELSKYMAAAVTRRVLNGTGRPITPHIFATFSNPIPGDPVHGNRIYLRTLPEKYTHQHRAPWLSRGYIRISDVDNEACPRYMDDDTQVIDHVTEWAGTQIRTPYRIE